MGAGSFNKKGIYSSMGTLTMMQEGNRRTDLNISDCRYAHTILGRMASRQYAEWGFGKERLALFGEKAKLIEEAFKAIKAGTMGIPVYSSTASINREVEKQSDIMLTQIMDRHYQLIANLIMQLNNPMIPPALKEYTAKAIKASDTLMKAVLKNFGHDDVERLVPAVDVEPPPQAGAPQPGAPAPGGQNGNSRPPAGQPQPNDWMARVSGGQGVPALPPGPAGLQ
jgi:hypothetical protein